MGKVFQNKSSQKQNNNNNNNNNNNKNQRKKQKVPAQQVWRPIPKVNKEWYEKDLTNIDTNCRDLVDAIISQDRTYVLPRPITTAVNANRYRFTHDINITSAQAATVEGSQRIILLRPEVKKFLSIGAASETQTTGAIDDQFPCTQTTNELSPNIALSIPVRIASVEGKVFEPTTALISDVVKEYHNGFEPFGYVTKMNVGATAPSTFTFYFKNHNPNSVGVTFRLRTYTGSDTNNLTAGALSMVLTQTVTSQSKMAFAFSAVVSPTSFSSFWAQLATADYFSVDVAVTAGWTPYDAPIDLVSSGFTIDTGFAFTDYSLWDLVPDSGDAESLYNKANSYSITGMNCIFQNNTPELSKGGVVYAARLPGRSEARLPKTYSQIQNVLRSIVDNNFPETNLDKGLFWYYTPEKVTDLYFEEISAKGSRPYAAVAFSVPSGISGNFVMTLSGIISIETITYSPAVPKFRSVACEPILSALCAALSSLRGWSHNPDHLRHIAESVRKVVTNDQFQMILKLLLQTGVKLAPMVISAVA